MKVVPKPKMKFMRANELRVINIDKPAVEELLLEYIMEKAELYFEIPQSQCMDISFYMNWDANSGQLTYIAAPDNPPYDRYEPNFSKIRAKTGITTTSLFRSKRFCTLRRK